MPYIHVVFPGVILTHVALTVTSVELLSLGQNFCILGRADSAEGHRSSAPRSSIPQTGSRLTAAARRQQQRQRKEAPSGCGEKIARFSMPSLMLAGEILRQARRERETERDESREMLYAKVYQAGKFLSFGNA